MTFLMKTSGTKKFIEYDVYSGNPLNKKVS
jgi:hypothetical protein